MKKTVGFRSFYNPLSINGYVSIQKVTKSSNQIVSCTGYKKGTNRVGKTPNTLLKLNKT
jgi:hypothetical protein